MSESFFEKPILNSPYEYPARHWELDETGQPTNHILEQRRARGRRSDVARRKGSQEAHRVFAGAIEERFVYDHRPILWPKSAPTRAGST